MLYVCMCCDYAKKRSFKREFSFCTFLLQQKYFWLTYTRIWGYFNNKNSIESIKKEQKQHNIISRHAQIKMCVTEDFHYILCKVRKIRQNIFFFFERK